MSCMSSALKRQTKKREQYEVHIPPHPVRRRTRFTCLRFSKGHTWLNCLKAAKPRKHHLECYHTNWTILGQTVNPEKCVTTYKRERLACLHHKKKIQRQKRPTCQLYTTTPIQITNMGHEIMNLALISYWQRELNWD